MLRPLATLDSRFPWGRRGLIALLVVVVGAGFVGLVRLGGQRLTMSPSFGYYVPTPANLDELITARDGGPLAMIVLGRVEDLAEVGWEPTKTPEPAPTWVPQFDQPWPYSLYRVAPERVFLDDGSAGGHAPVLVYRDEHPGYPHEPEFYPQEQTGERYLYFLERDRNYYFPSRFPYSRLIVDGDVVT